MICYCSIWKGAIYRLIRMKRPRFVRFWSFQTPSSSVICYNSTRIRRNWLLSSNTYSSEIDPDPRLRRLVLATGWIAMLLGVVTILSLPVAGFLRAASTFVWCAIVGAELGFISSTHKRFTRLRISSEGECDLRNKEGEWVAAKIAGGCVVLAQMAWLRLQLPSGRCHLELVSGDVCESEQWRRLQVIWRHLGAAR